MVRQINQNQIWKKKFRFNKFTAVISLIIILFLIISISGCSSLKIGNYNIDIKHVNSTDTINNTDIKKSTITSEERIKNNSSNEISETILSITDKLSKCGKTLTSEQCDYWIENNINNKYVTWSGTIEDVRDGIVFIIVKNSGIKRLDNSMSDAHVSLYDIKKDELLKLNKGDNIVFKGKINIREIMSMNYYSSWTSMIEGANIDGISLHDSKII